MFDFVKSYCNLLHIHYNGLGHRTGVRQGVAEAAGLAGVPDTGTGSILPKAPEIWNKETEYVIDFTKNYHNLLQKEEDGESYSYLNDMQGSTMRLLDHSGGHAASYGYDEFGEDLYGNRGKFQPFGYTGYRKDMVAGTYHARAREYDAGAGRFTGEDIIKGNIYFPISINQYLYCKNQPIDYIDSDGMSRQDAREYMEKYATDEKSERNPDYPSFSSNCANFVSQSLVAGGIEPIKYKWFCTSDLNANKLKKILLKIGSKEHQIAGHNVYYNDADSDHDVLLSDTWNNANAQYHYFSNPDNGYINGDVIKAGSYEELQEILKEYDIQTGDLLYWSREGNDVASHATIISKADSNYLYYAGNTRGRFDEKVTSDQFDTYEYIYIVRLRDEVFEEDGCLE